MAWLTAAVERAMKRQEVILRALSGALSWLQAADILGIHPRSLRRWRARYETDHVLGLYDRRQLPSRHKAPVAEVLLRRAPAPGWPPSRQGRRPVDRDHLTHVGRALARLGIEHIGAYSPQARGRGERLNRTRQDRLVNELRVAGISTVAAANAYLRDQFIADYNATFTRPPVDPGSDLDQVLCVEEERCVGQDNTVTFDGVRLQLAKQPGRRSCAGLRISVRRHLDGAHTVWRGPQWLGHYAPTGVPVPHQLERAVTGRFRGAGAHLPPAAGRGLRRGVPAYRVGPRLPVGPGL